MSALKPRPPPGVYDRPAALHGSARRSARGIHGMPARDEPAMPGRERGAQHGEHAQRDGVDHLSATWRDTENRGAAMIRSQQHTDDAPIVPWRIESHQARADRALLDDVQRRGDARRAEHQRRSLASPCRWPMSICHPGTMREMTWGALWTWSSGRWRIRCRMFLTGPGRIAAALPVSSTSDGRLYCGRRPPWRPRAGHRL